MVFAFKIFYILHVVPKILEYQTEVKKLKNNILINIFIYLTSPITKRKYEKHNRVCFVNKNVVTSLKERSLKS